MSSVKFPLPHLSYSLLFTSDIISIPNKFGHVLNYNTSLDNVSDIYTSEKLSLYHN
jgi:hypothetical protein